MILDFNYFLFLAPAIALAAWAQYRLRSIYQEASQLLPSSRMTGAQVAANILRTFGLERSVDIEPAHGVLGDHYDPSARVLRLSPDVYHGHSLAAFGIAAHEVGHAIQHAQRYPLLTLRNAVVPLASFGSNASWFLLLFGFAMNSINLIIFGIGLFSLVVIFQLINLPVEYDASRRAKEVLVSHGFISPAENKEVSKVLSAAALTYVAATLTSVLTLLYYLFLVRNRE